MSEQSSNLEVGDFEYVPPPLPTYSDARVNRADDVAQYNRATVEGGLFDLMRAEIVWRERFLTLRRHGYLLRHRFRPGWKPSWLGTNINPFHCEDAYTHQNDTVIDAIRIKDNSIVAIKRVSARSKEIEIGCMLSSADRIQDPMNHCTPILDTFEDENDDQTAYIVMPLYREFDDPPFYSVEEVVEFVIQTLEGLVYLHSQNVAHRDLSDRNIMMDASSMYPDGFHPSWQERSSSAVAYPSKYVRRAESGGVRYVFVDFGESSYFSNPEEEPPLVTGGRALDHDVPELNDLGFPYSPFPVDVFTLGNVYRKQLCSKFKNLSFLRPLSEAMTRRNPEERPTASQALEMARELIGNQSAISLRWRLHPVDENPIARILRDIRPLIREIQRFLKAYSVKSVDALLVPVNFVTRTIKKWLGLLYVLIFRKRKSHSTENVEPMGSA